MTIEKLIIYFLRFLIFCDISVKVCCVSLLAGLLILLRSATRITHKAQAVTCLAAKWHVCATIDSFDTVEAETPAAGRGIDQSLCNRSSEGNSDSEDAGDEEDELDNCKFVPSYAYSTISFQKRQALGKTTYHTCMCCV